MGGRRALRPPLRAAEVRQDELLRRVLPTASGARGSIPITVDLYGVLSVADVTVRIERAYARQLKGKTRARIEEFLQSTGLGLSLGAFGVSAQLQIDPKIDPLPALHALLDLPLRLEAGGGYRALIVFDEFQDIVKVRSGCDPAQPHPVPGRGRLVRLLRLRARDDGAALREQANAAVRLGGPMRLERLATRTSRRT